jgi:hypothetical protein
MKYLILRKRPDIGESSFAEMVAAGGPDVAFPFQADAQELSDHDVGDPRRDPSVEQDASSTAHLQMTGFSKTINPAAPPSLCEAAHRLRAHLRAIIRWQAIGPLRMCSSPFK